MKNKLTLSFIAYFYFLAITPSYAHKNHSNKPKIPAIGVVQGTVLDSLSSSPL